MLLAPLRLIAFTFHLILLVGETFAFGTTTAMSSTPTAMKQHTLYDVPVSNNGARCRLILYKKGIDDSQVQIWGV
jgi:hypothetical protein